jgi:hypothetical protein
VHLLAVTLRTLDLALVVFLNCKDALKWFLAPFAEEPMARPMDLGKMPAQLDFYATVYIPETPVSRQAVVWKQTGFQ